jgi:hypothetical protein
MATIYLLPCTCGETLRIDANQAGLDVPCRCGKVVKAPTLRGLSQLERVEDAAAAKPLPEWGTRHRLALIGSLIVVCGLTIAGWYWFTTPPYDPKISIDPRIPKRVEAEVAAMPAEKLIETWEKLAQEKLDRSEPPDVVEYRRMVLRRRGFMYAGLAVVAIGGLVLASAFILDKPKTKPAR